MVQNSEEERASAVSLPTTELPKANELIQALFKAVPSTEVEEQLEPYPNPISSFLERVEHSLGKIRFLQGNKSRSKARRLEGGDWEENWGEDWVTLSPNDDLGSSYSDLYGLGLADDGESWEKAWGNRVILSPHEGLDSSAEKTAIEEEPNKPPPSLRRDREEYDPFTTPPSREGFRRVQRKRIVPQKASTKDVTFITNDTRRYLALQQKERLFQARSTFTVALSCLIVGMVTILIGIFCAFFINLSIATVTSASSVVMDIVGLLCFKFSKEANDRYDGISQQQRNLTMFSTSMSYITTYISDPEKQKASLQMLGAIEHDSCDPIP